MKTPKAAKVAKYPGLFYNLIKRYKRMWLINFWAWPLTIISDIKQWVICRNAYKESVVKDLFKQCKYPLRVDKIGRVYTVINVPEELYDYDKASMVWPYVVEQLRIVDETLRSAQLSDLLFPDVKKIEREASFAYLVVLSPSTESLSFSDILKWLIALIVWFVSIKVVLKYYPTFFSDFFTSIFNIIF